MYDSDTLSWECSERFPMINLCSSSWLFSTILNGEIFFFFFGSASSKRLGTIGDKSLGADSCLSAVALYEGLSN